MTPFSSSHLPFRSMCTGMDWCPSTGLCTQTCYIYSIHFLTLQVIWSTLCSAFNTSAYELNISSHYLVNVVPGTFQIALWVDL